MNKTIFSYNEKCYCVGDIAAALRQVGIKKGDSVFVHSDLKSFGKINPELTRDEYAGAFVSALLDVVGENGNIIMPTFSYSFCKDEIYDPEKTTSKVGILSEYFRKMHDVKRSIDPIFSVAAFGPKRDYFTDVDKDCFGAGSVFDKMHKQNVKIIFLGETFDMTYLHYIEQSYGVPHRSIKRFSGKIKTGSDLTEYNFDYCVRPLDQNINYDLDELSGYLEESRVLSVSNLGNSKIRSVMALDAFNEIKKAFDKGKYFLSGQNSPKAEAREKTDNFGKEMFDLIKKMFPICRSITGNGNRQTLKLIQEQIPIKINEVPTGTKAFDWTVPKEWDIKDAYILDEDGRKLIDFQKSNLHVVGYSVPVNATMPLSELQDHLYSLPEQPDAIPYVTSYYKEQWGFCLAHKDKEKLKDGKYRVFIDSELKDGSLTYGELIIPGRSKREVFLSTYICHPSMANNELSGPAVATYLAKWLLSNKRKYTYRIIFIPETIGSIVYLSRHLKEMKKNMIAGFNVSCVGDNMAYSYVPTRNGDTYSDKVALNVLSFRYPNFIKYSFLDRGSDERQYNSPGVDLPVCSVMRSKYGAYPEYHTSLDDLGFISHEGLLGSYDILKECLTLIEEDRKYKIKCIGEPQLGKRGLYPTTSTKTSGNEVKNMMNFIAYADGHNDLIDISNRIKTPVHELYPIIEKLKNADLLTAVDQLEYK